MSPSIEEGLGGKNHGARLGMVAFTIYMVVSATAIHCLEKLVSSLYGELIKQAYPILAAFQAAFQDLDSGASEEACEELLKNNVSRSLGVEFSFATCGHQNTLNLWCEKSGETGQTRNWMGRSRHPICTPPPAACRRLRPPA